MELHLSPESPLTDLTDTELVDLLDENYYTLTATGEEAVNNVAWDIAQGTFAEYHGLSDERMGLALVLFAKRMSKCWKTPAMEYHEVRRFQLMSDFINSIAKGK